MKNESDLAFHGDAKFGISPDDNARERIRKLYEAIYLLEHQIAILRLKEEVDIP